MCKQIMKKIRSRSGETLTEVLVALLIIALSSMLLVVMVNTAARIDLLTRDRDKRFYAELTLAETREGDASDGTIKVTDVTGVDKLADGTVLQIIDVTAYGGDGLSSYQAKADTSGGGAP